MKAPTLERRCDCCSDSLWDYAFSDNGFDLFRCTECGLYTINPLHAAEERNVEVATGTFGKHSIPAPITQANAENTRTPEFQHYLDLITSHVSGGGLMDIGCGTGTLLKEAQQRGFVTEGIELVPERAALASNLTGSPIHQVPLEQLHLAGASYDAIAMINVFSHLISPRATFLEIFRLLKPGGVALLHTGEVGPGVKKHHSRNWELGDHVHWLGPSTIQRYAEIAGFTVVEHHQTWAPRIAWSRQSFATPGKSQLRNLIKSTILRTPVLLPVVQRIMLFRARNAPTSVATIILKKP